MSVTVRIPDSLRALTAGAAEVSAEASSVAELFERLEARHPGFRSRVLDDRGVRRFVNVYVNEEDVRFSQGLATPLRAGDVVSVVPAIAGGA